MSTGTATPQPWEFARDFMLELEKPETFLRTERPNALGCFDTTNWGEVGKKAIAAVLRAELMRTVPEVVKP